MRHENQKLNEKCYISFGFYNTFKADNYTLSTVSKANGMIGWLVRNFISRELYVVKANVDLYWTL